MFSTYPRHLSLPPTSYVNYSTNRKRTMTRGKMDASFTCCHCDDVHDKMRAAHRSRWPSIVFSIRKEKDIISSFSSNLKRWFLPDLIRFYTKHRFFLFFYKFVGVIENDELSGKQRKHSSELNAPHGCPQCIEVNLITFTKLSHNHDAPPAGRKYTVSASHPVNPQY